MRNRSGILPSYLRLEEMLHTCHQSKVSSRIVANHSSVATLNLFIMEKASPSLIGMTNNAVCFLDNNVESGEENWSLIETKEEDLLSTSPKLLPFTGRHMVGWTERIRIWRITIPSTVLSGNKVVFWTR